MVPGKLEIHMPKNEVEILPPTIYKNYFMKGLKVTASVL